MLVQQLVVILVLLQEGVRAHLEAISVPVFFVNACSAVVILVGMLGGAPAAATKLKKRLESFIPFLPLVYLKFSPAQKLIYFLTLVGEDIKLLIFLANAELTFWKVWILSSQAQAAHQPLRNSQLWRSPTQRKMYTLKNPPCVC